MADRLVVVDTDLVIDFLRGRDPGASWVRERLQGGVLRLTAVTAFELRVGTGFLADAPRIVRLLAGRTLPLDAAGALRAGEIFGALRAEGQGIDVKDALQAGVCLRHGLPLATRNERHFGRVPGLGLTGP